MTYSTLPFLSIRVFLICFNCFLLIFFNLLASRIYVSLLHHSSTVWTFMDLISFCSRRALRSSICWRFCYILKSQFSLSTRFSSIRASIKLFSNSFVRWSRFLRSSFSCHEVLIWSAPFVANKENLYFTLSFNSLLLFMFFSPNLSSYSHSLRNHRFLLLLLHIFRVYLRLLDSLSWIVTHLDGWNGTILRKNEIGPWLTLSQLKIGHRFVKS